jgi:flagellar biosynthesis regulator FlbT
MLLLEPSVLQKDYNVKMIAQMYNLAMMTSLDEIESDRHQNMIFVEFLEALVRVAERLEMPHAILVSMVSA